MTNKETKQSCPSTWLLERYYFGFLGAKGSLQVEQHLAGCPSCQEGLAALQAEDLPPLVWESEALPLPEPFAPSVLPQPPRQKLLFWESFLPGAWLQQLQLHWRPLLYAGALGVVALFALLSTGVTPSPPGVGGHWTKKEGGGTIKGSPQTWQIYARDQAGKVRVLREKQTIQQKDTLRFRFSLKRSLYFMVVSVNAQGEVSLYFPYPTKRAVRLPRGAQMQPEDSSIPLDQYVGEELFVAIGHTERFTFAEVKRALTVLFRKAQGRLSRLGKIEGFSWGSRLLVEKIP